jgi:hypothetical protein
MANTKNFSVSIYSNRETLTVTDSITYTDPLRDDVAVYFSAAKVSYENVETVLTVTSNDGDPLTDSAWSFDYVGDGYYKMRYIAVPLYDVDTEYSQYDAVYSSGSVYRSKVDSNTGQSVSNTNYWEPISDPTALCDNKGDDNESENCDSTIYERVFTSNGQYAYGNLIAENCMCTDCDDQDIIPPYDLFSLWLNGAIKCDERTEVLLGELICRKIQSRFID